MRQGLTRYIERDHDRRLRARVARAAAGEGQIATLISDTTAGKKRALFEAIHATPSEEPTPLLADWWIWPGMSPEDPHVLLAQIMAVAPRTVLWLPGAERYLLDPGDEIGNAVGKALCELVHDERRRPSLVLCTLRSRAWQQLTAPRRPGQPDVLLHARRLLTGSEILVPCTFTADEVERAMTSGDLALAEAAAHAPERYVIQYLQAVPDLEARFDTCGPEQRAVLQCAIDARRMGHSASLSRPLLEQGALGYLSTRNRNILGENWFDDAVTALTVPGAGDASMLIAHLDRTAPGGNQGCLRLDDYLERQRVTEISRSPLPKPDLWPALIAHASTDSLLPLARECWRRGLRRESCQLYLRAAADDSTAHRELADKLRRVGRIDEALEQYRQLIESSDTTAVFTAAEVLLTTGQPDAAIEWLRPRVASGSPDAIALTAMAYSRKAEQATGNEARQARDTAIELYQQLGVRGDLRAALTCADMLANDDQRDEVERVDAAVKWLMRLADEYGMDTTAEAADLLTQVHGPDTALAQLHDRAEACDHAAYLLGARILTDHDRTEEALDWITSAVDYGVPGALTYAAKIHAKVGMVEPAIEFAEAAAAVGDCRAFTEVGEELASRRLRQRALECFVRAAEHGDPSAWAAAARTAAEAGWHNDAFGFVRGAQRATDTAASALIREVAVELCRSGDPHDAIAWYLKNTDTSAHDVLVPLSEFLLDREVAQSAAAAYMRVTATGRSQALAWVAEGLVRADLHEEAATAHDRTRVAGGTLRRKLAEAATWFRQAADAGNTAALARAIEALIQLRRFDEAAKLLEHAEHNTPLDTCRAIVLAHQGQFGPAMTLLERQLQAGNTAAVVPIATALFRSKQSPEALVVLQRGIDAGDTAAHLALADHHRRHGRYEDALELCLIALTHGHDDAIDKIGQLPTRRTRSRYQETLDEINAYGVTSDGRPSQPWAIDLRGQITDISPHFHRVRR